MKILFFIIVGILKGEIIYENKEVKLLKELSPVLIVKETSGIDYKIIVHKGRILLFKKDKIIFKYEEMPDKKIKVKEKIKEGIYDVQGRKLGKGLFKKKGIYFEKSKDKRINKFFILR